jgi:ankyrin repeat protein
MVSLLLDARAHANTLWKGKTALEVAAVDNKPDIMSALRAKGGMTWIEMMKVRFGVDGLVGGVIDADIDSVNKRVSTAVDEEKEIALIIASLLGHHDIACILLSSDADPNARHYCRTPLLSAGKRGHVAIVEALLEAGACMKARDGDGKTAIQLASINKHREVALALLKGDKERKNENK